MALLPFFTCFLLSEVEALVIPKFDNLKKCSAPVVGIADFVATSYLPSSPGKSCSLKVIVVFTLAVLSLITLFIIYPPCSAIAKYPSDEGPIAL